MNKEEAIKTLHLKGNTFSSNILKFAYRRCAQLHHPDRGGSESDMKRVNQAYSILTKYTTLPKVNKDQQLQHCNIQQFLYNEWGIKQSADGNFYIPLDGGLTLAILNIQLFDEHVWILSHINSKAGAMMHSFYKEISRSRKTCKFLKELKGSKLDTVIKKINNY